MSLQYIIDGYNVIRHPSFNHLRKINPAPLPKMKSCGNTERCRIKDVRVALAEFIKTRCLCGSSKNKITIVFDGNPNVWGQDKNIDDTTIVFTNKETADEWIKRRVESEANPKKTIVVSDDKEIRFFIKSVGGRSIGVDEFINRKEKTQRVLKRKDAGVSALKPELTYSQIYQINQELRKIWLK